MHLCGAAWLGLKFLGAFTLGVVKCTTSAECKTVITAVLTVTSGLDPHMINKLKDGLKSNSGWFGVLAEYDMYSPLL